MEHLKHDQNDFGGFQIERLSPEEIAQRICARRFCSSNGVIQVQVPLEDPPVYRVFCGRHYAFAMVIFAAVMGDPSPLSEGKRIAGQLGIPWAANDEVPIPIVVDMSNAICDRCGGSTMLEVAGMYRGRRWVHTCMSEEERSADSGRV